MQKSNSGIGKKKIKKLRSDLLKEIKTNISELLAIVGKYNVLDVIAPLTILNLSTDPETYTESTHKGREGIVEYFQSVILAQQLNTSPISSSPKIIQKVIDLLNNIYDTMINYYMFEFEEKGSMTVEESNIRFQLITQALNVRGPSYSQHTDKTFLELYTKWNNLLFSTYGFKAEDLLDFIHYFSQEIEKQFNATRNRIFSPQTQGHKIYLEYVEKYKNLTPEEFEQKYRRDNKELLENAQNNIKLLHNMGGIDQFEVQLRNSLDSAIAKVISLNFGENHEFGEIKNFEYFPLNPSLIGEKPLIHLNNKYFCFNLALAHRNMGKIVEKLILDISSDAFENFCKKRGKYLEEQAMEFFKIILKITDKDLFVNLYYGEYELDGLIKYGDILLLVEMKAGKLGDSAYRGSILSFLKDMDDLLGYGVNQGFRAKQYIESNSPAVFYDETRQQEIIRVNKNDFQNIYVITTYFEPISFAITQLNLMKSLEIVDDVNNWAIYLNDLRIISEINEHPTIFLHYLKQRLSLNLLNKYTAHDELDYYMAYLKTRLIFTEEETGNSTDIVLSGFTEDLDSYYFFLEGKRSKVEKPKLYLPECIDKLLTKLETQQPLHFIELAYILLEINQIAWNSICENITYCETNFIPLIKMPRFTLGFKEQKLILGFSMIPTNDIDIFSKRWLNNLPKDKSSKDEFSEMVIVYWEVPFNLSKNLVIKKLVL